MEAAIFIESILPPDDTSGPKTHENLDVLFPLGDFDPSESDCTAPNDYPTADVPLSETSHLITSASPEKVFESPKSQCVSALRTFCNQNGDTTTSTKIAKKVTWADEYGKDLFKRKYFLVSETPTRSVLHYKSHKDRLKRYQELEKQKLADVIIINWIYCYTYIV